MITLEEAKAAKKGDILYHVNTRNSTAKAYKVIKVHMWANIHRVECLSLEGHSVRVMYHSPAWGKRSLSGNRWFFSLRQAHEFIEGGQQVEEEKQVVEEVFLIMKEVAPDVYACIGARSLKQDAHEEAAWRSKNGSKHKVQAVPLDEKLERAWLVRFDARTWTFNAALSHERTRGWNFDGTVIGITILMAENEEQAIERGRTSLLRLMSEIKEK